MQGTLVKYLIMTILLTFGATANAVYVVESSPGVVTGIGDNDIGGTLYNVDFESVNDAFSIFSGNENFLIDSASALTTAAAIESVLVQEGCSHMGALNNGSYTGTIIWSACAICYPDDLIVGGIIIDGALGIILLKKQTFIQTLRI